MRPAPKSLNSIIKSRLCNGCGTCAFMASDVIEMKETKTETRRPQINGKLSRKQEKAIIKACPGMQEPPIETSAKTRIEDAWGPVLEVWEGYAKDPAIRFKGSSGGAVTALALFTMEEKKFTGTLHVKSKESAPTLNEASLSLNKAELTAGSGSRYAPASICDKLGLVEKADGPCTIIGKPCDIRGAIYAAKENFALDARMGLTISIFCAGTPSHAATDDLLKYLSPEEPAEKLQSLKYRGDGWPGNMVATWQHENGRTSEKSTTYNHGWGSILQKKRQWRCHTCADHTGEYADFSIGDPWQRPTSEDANGRSLIIVRTKRAQRMLREAREAGYLHLEKRSANILFDAQPNLYATKGAVWGRSFLMKAIGLQAPKLTGAAFRCWIALKPKAKTQSILGTLKRVFKKRLYKAAAPAWLKESSG